MAFTKRVEVLFEPEDYEQLEKKARQEGRSVGEIVREAVSVAVVDPAEKRRAAAFEWLTSQTIDEMGGDWEDIKREIAEERTRQIEKSLEAD